MGLFQKLFGSAGSDKADKMRQAAIDAFNAIQTPELKDLQVQLEHYVMTGRLTPEQAEAELLNSNAFNDIVTDPSLAAAQKQALTALQEIGTQGGLTAIDKARMKDITNEQNQVARGRNEAILSEARRKGMGSSDITTINQLMNEQAAADRAADQGVDVAANAEARALQALIQGGQTAGQIRAQDYGEQANKAQAQNAIDLFNKQTLNQTNLYNVDAANKAQAANLANEQAIANANVGTTNEERVRNAAAVQQKFANEMGKASGKAGVYTGWANAADADNRAENAADMALLGGAIQGVATAFGGPAGAAATAKPAAGGFDPNTMSTNPAYDYDRVMRGYAEGGMVKMDKEEFKDEHDRLLNVLENPSPVASMQEAERQKKEMAAQGFNCGGKVGMNQGGETPQLPIQPGEDDKWTILDPNGEIVGSFDSYADAVMYADKVRQKQPKVSDFRNGGSVPGQAPVAGDHPANDIVPAKLSPGEVVVPRTAMSDDEEFDAFMEKFRPSKRVPQGDPDKPMMVQALQNLSARVDRMEGR